MTPHFWGVIIAPKGKKTLLLIYAPQGFAVVCERQRILLILTPHFGGVIIAPKGSKNVLLIYAPLGFGVVVEG